MRQGEWALAVCVCVCVCVRSCVIAIINEVVINEVVKVSLHDMVTFEQRHEKAMDLTKLGITSTWKEQLKCRC